MKKKKILLLSDDLRMHSGIATVSRDIVLSTVDQYDWVQVSAAIQHPEKGKVIDISEDVKKITKVDDAYVRLIPYNGYGDPFLIREIMEVEKPDAILHFTDPRFWDWLYEMEHEIRTKIPLMYLNIWDDIPDPWYNREAYSSCDLLMAISKQTYGINRRILDKYEGSTTKNRITYVPHGISETEYFPIDTNHPAYEKFIEFKNQTFNNREFDFVVFWNNRNIRRKNPGDLIFAFKEFVEKLSPEQAAKCLLLMHTHPVDDNGTHIPQLLNEIAPNINVAFSDKQISREIMNYLYNLADVTVNVSSNEGFGLATAESVMAGTPIIVNVTGGLQDQCGFAINENGNFRYLMENDYIELQTLHDYRKWKNNENLIHGKWVTPVWPSNRSLQGSVPTPYIFDDRVDYIDVADALMGWYNISRDERKAFGKIGREYMLNPVSGLSLTSMSTRVKYSIDACMSEFQKKKSFTITKI